MSKQQKFILIVSILASFVAFLDGSIINVALPAISKEVGGGLSAQQWVVDAYLITLGSLILLAGSLSDMFGRKKLLIVGLAGFALASVLCAIAPSSSFLIGARALQGVAGALIVPSSLALIISSFSGASQGKAIGAWTGWTGISFIVGPLLGGFLVDSGSWRWIFIINLLPIAITFYFMSQLTHEHKKESRAKVDVVGALLGVVGLGGPVYALIEQPNYGWTNPQIFLPAIIGLTSLVVFIWHEKHTKQPMLPLELFRARNFTVGNLSTIVIYGGLSVATFLISIFVQQVGGYTALKAGATLLPVTIIMLLFSGRFGGLAAKYGPRLFMGFGPVVAAAGFLFMLHAGEPLRYWTQLFPGVLLFGVGLSMTVAPLTTAVLGSINSKRAGIGSAVNNAVSRIAGLMAIAFIGLVTGPILTPAGFKRGLLVMAGLLVLGGLISIVGIQNVTIVPEDP